MKSYASLKFDEKHSRQLECGCIQFMHTMIAHMLQFFDLLQIRKVLAIEKTWSNETFTKATKKNKIAKKINEDEMWCRHSKSFFSYSTDGQRCTSARVSACIYLHMCASCEFQWAFVDVFFFVREQIQLARVHFFNERTLCEPFDTCVCFRGLYA